MHIPKHIDVLSVIRKNSRVTSLLETIYNNSFKYLSEFGRVYPGESSSGEIKLPSFVIVCYYYWRQSRRKTRKLLPVYLADSNPVVRMKARRQLEAIGRQRWAPRRIWFLKVFYRKRRLFCSRQLVLKMCIPEVKLVQMKLEDLPLLQEINRELQGAVQEELQAVLDKASLVRDQRHVEEKDFEALVDVLVDLM